MQNYQFTRTSGQNDIYSGGNGQNHSDMYAISTDNRFAPLPPLNEWVGYSMNCEPGFEHMEVDAVRNKRR